ncbi:MAG: DUF4097 family beta strand repeat-containing protein [Ktedonobacteraceae bacterium]
MNNQEGQFMSPDPRNTGNDFRAGDEYIPRPINTDPWEQQQQWQGVPPQQQQMYGEKLQPRQRRRRGPRGCIIALVTVLIILCLSGIGIGFGIAGIGYSFPRFGPGVTEARSFTVGTSPHLIINDPVGAIHVHTGTTNNQVSIQATKQSTGIGGNPSDIHVSYNESSDNNTITVNVDYGPSFMGFKSVDFNISVPGASDLNVNTNTGSIDVSGINGQMSLTSNTGSINATQDDLTSSSTLKTDTGSVTFDGKIASTGSYQFLTNTGSVNVTLPGDTSFHVDASTDTGSVNSNFPGVSPIKHDIGSEVHADVGNSPSATLMLKTNTGSINLNEG